MICNDSKEVILTCDIENRNNSIKSYNIDNDIENGLYYMQSHPKTLNTLYESVYNSKKNNLISIISNVSYISYNFLKNIKEMVSKKIKN